ncbi:uncharacterized protein [Triticum aestivum]|uniref:uncharacterized protein n=1 Tax=Triticum aestivum TaxID=4565 RepID=UPI001D003E8E|nr:uncharacterized protein LOC123157841 [Triticum aestivum]
MREESESHFEMIMNRPSVEEMNKASYIGGCLPIWGVNNANSVPEALNEDTSIDSKSPRIISEGPCCTAKVEQNVKVKQEPHLKPEVPSQDVVKQEPIGPKFENISVLNSVYQTPIFPVHGTSLNTNSVEQATTSQPKVCLKCFNFFPNPNFD